MVVCETDAVSGCVMIERSVNVISVVLFGSLLLGSLVIGKSVVLTSVVSLGCVTFPVGVFVTP